MVLSLSVMIPVEAVRFRHEIETPLPLRAEGGRLQLKGWCLAAGASQAPPIRLTGAALRGTEILRTSRPDVVEFLQAAPSAENCGFSIEGSLPHGAHLLALEALDGLIWRSVREFTVVATHSDLHVSIEWPTESVVRESVRIQGWCAHPDFALAEIGLHYGNRQIRCHYGLARADVPRLLPTAPNAAHAGFVAEKNISAGYGPLRIRAVTTTGQILFSSPPVQIDIPSDEENTVPLDLHGAFAGLGPARRNAPPAPVVSSGAPARRILFALYGDFTSNSAIHVAQLANALVEQGHECAVAVPHHVETIRYHPLARFQAVLFTDCLRNPAVFRDGRAADLIHAWTTRENVRRFCEQLRQQRPCPLVVHLEDHEQRLLEATLGRTHAELMALPEAELDRLVPPILSHPRRSRDFLASAAAVTVILDRLRELVPTGKPVHVIWPAADETCFFPRPIPWAFRQALGWGEDHTVLFYHGNVHATNQVEVRELYAAVAELNETGQPTTLIRTGRDSVDFLGHLAARTARQVVTLGQIDFHHHLPPLMALADYFVQPGGPDAFNDYRLPSKLPEFFALGRPVILPRTNLGAVLRHGEEAWVLDRADAAGIAGAIRALRADPTLRDRLAAGARQVAAARFNWRRSGEALLAAYNSLPSRV
jgi:glycosyltransferase involved in cell wall biosynthesis